MIFVAGYIVGSMVTVVLMSVCVVAGRAEREFYESNDKNENK